MSTQVTPARVSPGCVKGCLVIGVVLLLVWIGLTAINYQTSSALLTAAGSALKVNPEVAQTTMQQTTLGLLVASAWSAGLFIFGILFFMFVICGMIFGIYSIVSMKKPVATTAQPAADPAPTATVTPESVVSEAPTPAGKDPVTGQPVPPPEVLP